LLLTNARRDSGGIPDGEDRMKHNVMLMIASLSSLVLLTFHLADDIVRGFEKGGVENLIAVPICVIWLYGTLMLADRRSGHVIILLFSLLGMFVPVIHMMGRGVGVHSRIGNTSGAIFFVWSLLAIGVSALFSVILSLQGLWRLRGRQSQ
jgi:hypothetical protein